MRGIVFVAAMLATVSGIAIADEPVVEPTAFESFVARTSVILEVDEPVGSIASTDAKLEIAALVAADTANPPDHHRGLRLRFEDNAGENVVYVDESLVASTIGDLADIEESIAELKSGTAALRAL